MASKKKTSIWDDINNGDINVNEIVREDRGKKQRGTGFVGKSLHYTQPTETWEEMRGRIMQEAKEKGGSIATAYTWKNQRPICPYGCGEEGTLLEMTMSGNKALGIYTHSESVKPFVAELQMAPKPTGRKLKLGPDGEYHMVEDDD